MHGLNYRPAQLDQPVPVREEQRHQLHGLYRQGGTGECNSVTQTPLIYLWKLLITIFGMYKLTSDSSQNHTRRQEYEFQSCLTIYIIFSIWVTFKER